MTCTLWHYDRAKQSLLNRGTVGFDYEYLSRRGLSTQSFTKKVIDIYEKDLRETPEPMRELKRPAICVHRLKVSAGTTRPNESKAGWGDFSRKRKIGHMGITG